MEKKRAGEKKGGSPSSSESSLVPEVLPSVGTSAAEGCHTMTLLLYGKTLLYPTSTHYHKGLMLSGLYRAYKSPCFPIHFKRPNPLTDMK